MGYKRTLKNWVESLTGTYIFRYLPRGIDVFRDIEVALPGFRIETIFDVGANTGQSASTYVKRFPTARILCFEPVAETFRQLRSNTRKHEQIRCFMLALSSREGKGTVQARGTATKNRLLSESETLSQSDDAPLQEVDVTTLTAVCKAEKINWISYLKIDTEGGDLEVLKGAEDHLAQQRVDLVEVEAGMGPDNELHVPFGVLQDYLGQRGYVLFGIYEQAYKRAGAPSLRRTNPVFMSSRMVEQYRKRPAS